MSVYRQPNLTWRVRFPYRTEDGETQWVTEEGFPSKLEAIQWQNDSLPKKSGSIDMSFRDFAKDYCEDMAPHFRGKTLAAKENIINTLEFALKNPLPQRYSMLADKVNRI